MSSDITKIDAAEEQPVDAPVIANQLEAAMPQDKPADKFPIVGLGGSAGSLIAFERFFQALPGQSGMAFVVVTHLMPDQPSELATVLSSFTTMSVKEATDGTKVQPNHVYVIPPNRDMSLLHGTLLLFEPVLPAGRRLPVDFFLQSLAKDARERAVAIIFSGLGADGVVGLKLITENLGMVMVQDPSTAAYDSMPRAALATEFVDFVLPAEQLPGRLLEYAGLPKVRRSRRGEPESDSQPTHALQKIFLLIRAQTGHDFSLYKRNTVFRRIERRMNSHQIKEFTQYVRYLQENPAEVECLFKELLIGVTKFFRDAAAFEQLKARLLPLLRRKPANSLVRVWAPGCSTGEEAYSLAMCLLECLDAIEPDKYLQIQIFATDINSEGIDVARAGIYGQNIEADVSPERLNRFFTKTENRYQIKKEVRDVIIFALHNINKDAPFTRLDLLVCRNLLIYLSADLQRHLLPVFHYALVPDGLLFLGPSENLTTFQDLFQPLDIKWKISRRLNTPAAFTRLAYFPVAIGPEPATTSPAIIPAMTLPNSRKDGPFANLVQRLLLRQYTPPAVVINAKGDVLYVNGRTGRYLEPAPGLAGLNLFEMAREEMSYELSAAVHKAVSTREDVVAENVKVKTETGVQLLRLTVKVLNEPEQLHGMLLVVFEDQPTPRKVRLGKAVIVDGQGTDGAVQALEKELQYTRHRLQTTVEEMESSFEELKSTNEELQSANEELQSTNEEAMTNKEEMQSLNEELMTLNLQYLGKTEELGEAANDMKNLLDATEIATIFLGNDLVIKRFTPATVRIIPLLPSDVGRPITHFAANLRHETLAHDVQQVLDRLTGITTTIQTVAGDWFVMRILPYRTLDNYINGAVVTFIEVTALKTLEAELQASRDLAESIVETVREPLLVLDSKLRVLTVSQAFVAMFSLDAAQVRGQALHELDGGVWQDKGLRERIDAVLTDPTRPFDDYHFTTTFPQAGTLRLLVYGRCITSGGHHTGKLLLGIEEVD